MTELTYLFATLALLTGVMTSISIWAPRQFRLKLGALAAAGLSLLAAYAGFLHLLSMPKPVGLEWWHARAAEATVLASTIREDEGIYLWLQLSEAPEPRAYLLPWSRELAEQLQAARREAEENHTQLQMRLPFEPSLDDRAPKFYATPQPALPPKDLDQEPPKFYEHARRSAEQEA
jgi:hypothetical protein